MRTLRPEKRPTTVMLLWTLVLVLLIAYVAVRWHGLDTGAGLSITD